jgi:hypothetical protein
MGFRATPALHPAWRPLRVTPEVLSLGPCLVQGVTCRLLRLDNASDRPLGFAWDLAVFDRSRAVVSGQLRVQPEAGVVAPGEALVCQVVFSAGVLPQVFEGYVRLAAWAVEADEETDGGDGGQLGADDVAAAGGTGYSSSRSPSPAEGEAPAPGPLLGYALQLPSAAEQVTGMQQWQRWGTGQGEQLLQDDVTEEIIAMHPAR